MRAKKLKTELQLRALEVEQRRPVPKAQRAKAETDKEREKLDAIEARRQRRMEREHYQKVLWNNHHWGIRIRWTRATIGEIFNVARKDEALLTLRLGDPIIVPWKGMIDIVTSNRTTRASTDEVYQMLKNLSKTYGKDRNPVRHPVWRDPEKK